MEKAVLMMDYLNVTQKSNSSFSHRGDKALDIAGKDNGIDSFKAPFTGIIKKIYPNQNVIWLESVDKVKYADGTIDYMTVMTMHDNDISNLKVGNKIKQGTIYYQEGTKGYTTGNHIHLAVGKGKFSGSGWYENEYGYWPINNQYDVHKALYLLNSVNIINSGGYNWIKTNVLTEVDKLNKDDSIDTMIHVVKGGENLTKISKMYSTTINEIVKLNNIINKNLIYVGQKLIVPNNKTTYLKKYTGNSLSLVDSLKNVGIDSSFNYRTRIASANGIVNYIGTSIQNTYLLNLLKQGKLIRPKVIV